MLISVVNLSKKVEDEGVQPVLRAINTQIVQDFAPYWGMSATMRLEGRAADKPQREQPPELRGDAIIYLWDDADVDGALGYHDENHAGLPCGFVFTSIAEQIGEPWSVTLSHEALELIGDANVNRLAAGPHPADADRWVLHWYEMCDAVQAEKYEIDEVVVSNFVLPLYFTPGEQISGRNDFLGRRHNGGTLESFGVNPGGYVGFLDPETGEHNTYSMKDDEIAQWRLAVKQSLGASRRGVRYRQMPERAVRVTVA
jgi:hypothetical protein